MTPVAIISGGTSGIGLATATRQAAAGHRVVIFGRSAERLDRAAAAIRAAGAAGCQTIVADFRYPQQAVAAFRTAIATQGRCDLLVNAAAVAPLSPFEQTSVEAFDEVVNVNIRSIYLGTQAVWPTMREQGGGVIVNVSSLAAVSPFTGLSAYGASKAWLDIATRAWADEGRPHGIRAFSVRPGAVATPMLEELFPGFPADQTVSADQVAEVICQLALPAWRFSSGEAFTVSLQ